MFCKVKSILIFVTDITNKNFKIMTTQKTVREIRVILFETTKKALIDSKEMTNKEARDFLYEKHNQEELFNVIDNGDCLTITEVKKMTAIFKTKSNFKNCNNKPLEVVEITGTRISVLIQDTDTTCKTKPLELLIQLQILTSKS